MVMWPCRWSENLYSTLLFSVYCLGYIILIFSSFYFVYCFYSVHTLFLIVLFNYPLEIAPLCWKRSSVHLEYNRPRAGKEKEARNVVVCILLLYNKYSYIQLRFQALEKKRSTEDADTAKGISHRCQLFGEELPSGSYHCICCVDCTFRKQLPTTSTFSGVEQKKV